MCYLKSSFFAGILALITCTTAAQSVNETTLKLATASPTGSYFRVGTRIKQLCERNISQLSIEVHTTGGSVDNLTRLWDGEFDLAIAQNDISYMAENGIVEGNEYMSSFTGGLDGLRAVMTLYPEPIYVVAKPGYTRMNQLIGKTISIGQSGSGTSVNAKTILQEIGVWEAVNITYTDKSEIAPFFEADSIQAVFLNSYPDDVAAAIQEGKLQILSLPRTSIERLLQRFPYFASHRTELYNQQINTVAVKSILVARESIDEDLIYRITEELEREWGYFSRSFPSHQNEYPRIELVDKKALRLWHAGAEKYYYDSGLLRQAAPLIIIVLILLPIALTLLLGLINLFLFSFNRRGLELFSRKSRFLKIIKRANLLFLQYKYVLLGFLVIGSYLVSLLLLEFVEQSWARDTGVTNLFQNNSFIDNLLWLFVFAGSGYEGGIFPQSPVGKFIVSLIPIIGLSGSLAFIGIFATEKIKDQLLSQKGMNNTLKKNHIIICGWNKNVPKLTNYLVHENISHERPVVILADIEDSMPMKSYGIETDRVEYIKGSATNREDLDRANLVQADIALIVADEASSDPDASNILKILTIEKYCLELEQSGKRDTRLENIYTIAEINRPEYEAIARDAGVDEIISFREIRSKILAQSALHHGVNHFINEILTFNEFNDIYTIELKDENQLLGRNFDDILAILRNYNILLLSICCEHDHQELNNSTLYNSMNSLRESFEAEEINEKEFLRKMTEIQKDEQSRLIQLLKNKNEFDTNGSTRIKRRVITNPIDTNESNYLTKPGDALIVLARKESVVDEALQKLTDVKQGKIKNVIEKFRFKNKNWNNKSINSSNA